MPGPLDGIRVLDISTMLAAPLAAQILGDYGADVIKVEHPVRPDSLHNHGVKVNGFSLYWKQVARNKRCVAIDFSTEEGAKLLLEMVAKADVVIENFRPGTLARWGLGWEQLQAANPNIIVLRITGYGQYGPYSGQAAFGTVVEAMSGLAAITGEADGGPILPNFGLADSIAGVTGAGAVAMALYHRDAKGGGGQEIDLSLLAPIMSAVGIGPAIYQKTGALQSRLGSRGDGGTAPRNVYKTVDGGWVALSAVAQSVADRVFTVIGHEEYLELPWFQTNSGRWDHVDEVDALVGEWIGARSQEEVLRLFSEAGAAIGPVNTAKDILEDPQVIAAQFLVHIEDNDVGDVVQNAPLFKMSKTPGKIRFLGAAHASSSDEVFELELGKSKDELEKLRANGVIA
jgi:crotonobetainyl-CoA:carnitine CoA-transferase CaiB-like acyl-CoA transferase